MINVMRKNQKTLMIIITVLVIISFTWYWNKTDFAAVDSTHIGRVYGRDVSRVEFLRHARLLRLASMLGMMNFLQDLTAGAMDENSAYEMFTWNQLVLRHEADRLGIRPTNGEVIEAVRKFRAFAGEKGFDLNKYDDFTNNSLAPMGFTEAQIEELAADQLRLEKIKQLLAIGVHIPESENRANFEQSFGQMEVAVVRFKKEDFGKDLQISDEEIAKYFEAHKAQYTTEEKRKVKFVSFGLTEEQKKLQGKERIDALQKLADHANDFTQALLEKGADFDAVAAKFELPVKETSEFTQKAPDPQLPNDPQLIRAAFSLTEAEPTSDAFQAGDGFYTLRLTGVIPARPLSLEEAKPQIVDAIKAERVQVEMATRATEATRRIGEALRAGKPVEIAAQEAGVSVEKLPPFSMLQNPSQAIAPDKPAEAPDLSSIKQAVAELDSGQVSEYVQTEGGGLIAILEKRQPVEEAQYAAMKGLITGRYLSNKREVVFYEWLRERRREAGVETAQQS